MFSNSWCGQGHHHLPSAPIYRNKREILCYAVHEYIVVPKFWNRVSSEHQKKIALKLNDVCMGMGMAGNRVGFYYLNFIASFCCCCCCCCDPLPHCTCYEYPFCVASTFVIFIHCSTSFSFFLQRFI